MYAKHKKMISENKRTGISLTDTPYLPWTKITLEIVGPLPTTEHNNRYILTIQDMLTKCVINIPLEIMEAQTVAEAFIQDCILIYGIPSEIITDQGTNFVSKMFSTCCKLLEITRVYTAVYRPQSNGSLERYHRFLKDNLRCSKGTQEWDEVIKFVAFAYNISQHTSTKISPYEALFGRICNLSGALQKQPDVCYNLEDYVLQMKWQFHQYGKLPGITWKKANG